MYIVICHSYYDVWYEEFVSLDEALNYIEHYKSGVQCRLFFATELPISKKGF